MPCSAFNVRMASHPANLIVLVYSVCLYIYIYKEDTGLNDYQYHFEIHAISVYYYGLYIYLGIRGHHIGTY